MYSANLLLLNVFTVLVYGAFVFGLVASSRSIQFGAVFFLAERLARQSPVDAGQHGEAVAAHRSPRRGHFR